MIESTYFSPRRDPISRNELEDQFYRIAELLESRGLDSLRETNSEEELNYSVPDSAFQF